MTVVDFPRVSSHKKYCIQNGWNKPQVRGVGSLSAPKYFKVESAEIASTKVQLHPNLTTCFEQVNVSIL